LNRMSINFVIDSPDSKFGFDHKKKNTNLMGYIFENNLPLILAVCTIISTNTLNFPSYP
jgi:hypothetical protein